MKKIIVLLIIKYNWYSQILDILNEFIINIKSTIEELKNWIHTGRIKNLSFVTPYFI